MSCRSAVEVIESGEVRRRARTRWFEWENLWDIYTHTPVPPPLLHLLDDCYVNKRVVHKRLEMIKRNRKVERRRWRYLLLDLCASSYYLFLFFKNLFRLFSVVSSSRHNLNESAITLLLLLLFSLLFSHRLLIFNLFWFHRFCPSFFFFSPAGQRVFYFSARPERTFTNTRDEPEWQGQLWKSNCSQFIKVLIDINGVRNRLTDYCPSFFSLSLSLVHTFKASYM